MDDLVRRLRHVRIHTIPLDLDALTNQAAYRIETLTEQRDAARRDAVEAEDYATEVEKQLNICRMAQVVMENTVAELERQFFAAVEILRDALSDHDEHHGPIIDGSDPHWSNDVRFMLAAIGSDK